MQYHSQEKTCVFQCILLMLLRTSNLKNICKRLLLLLSGSSKYFNPIQDGSFWDCSRGWGAQKGPIPKICHIYLTMMKLGTVIPYLKKIQKNKYITWHTHWVLLSSAFFHWKLTIFVISRNTDIDCILIYNF